MRHSAIVAYYTLYNNHAHGTVVTHSLAITHSFLPARQLMSRSSTSCLSLLRLVLLLVRLIPGQCSSQGAATAASDREALLAIKDWGSPPQLRSWDLAAAANHCTWKGVTCDSGAGGVVTELSLSSLNLSGTVPASVCALRNLTRLDLSHNNLTGAFPAAALYACARLRFLDLSSNFFSGPLPRDIDGLAPVMEHLNLSTNGFSGEVPSAVARLRALRSLLLDTNRFTGAYPAAEISELTDLEVLTLAGNAFAPAPVPPAFAKLTKLTYLWMSSINLTGEIPEAFSSLTELRVFDLSMNKLTGSIPAWVLQHGKLEKLYLYKNSLPGGLTRNVTAVNLMELDLSMNQLSGEMPQGFGDLKNLTVLFLYLNNFAGTVPARIGLLPQLLDIRISDNRFSGELPPELGKHSPLGNLEMANNKLSGALPETLCANRKLNDIVAFNNTFSGALPSDLGECIMITNLMLYDNSFSGDFPEKIWSLPELATVLIQNNRFTGTLPAVISSTISRIEMGNNMFSGSLPTSATGLHTFLADNNRLAGELPADMSRLASLTELSVSGNRISGSITTSIKVLQKIHSLDLSDNRISGEIPPGSIGLIPKLTVLDLSGNELTGSIPSDMGDLPFSFFNISSNKLTGEVPAPLQIAVYDRSFLCNPGLCAAAGSGTNLPTCPRGGRGTGDKLSSGLIALLALLAGVVFFACVGIAWLLVRRRTDSQDVTHWKMTAFTQLDLTESDVLDNIHEENVIGSGGSGKVYRIHLGAGGSDEDGGGGRMVAVKKIGNASRMDAKLDKEFEAEVRVLGSIRHNNIVKLLCCISSQDAKLLVYEYMEHGSLDRWLHRRDHEGAPAPLLDWPTRLSIAVDAARGLSYMHHDCAQPIVHRDVKSSNILLDPGFRAKIADFGLARMLARAGQAETVSAMGGTFGYKPPEYGYTRKVNEKVDVYSFGVVLLELTTGKVTNDRGAEMCLAEWAWRRHQKGPPFDDVVDDYLRETADLQDVLAVFTIGVICTGESPDERPSMKEILNHLTRCCCGVPTVEAETCPLDCAGSGDEEKQLAMEQLGLRPVVFWDDDEDSII